MWTLPCGRVISSEKHKARVDELRAAESDSIEIHSVEFSFLDYTEGCAMQFLPDGRGSG
jgi:hypothetical protein